jgi:type II secretory pathway pseudopilin PulG
MHTAPGRTACRSAFTLIETMLAFVIVTMLATLVVPSLLSLRSDATTDRAKAEITAALSDARSLARARSMPVIVSISAPDADGTSQITATVVTAVQDIASSLGNAGDAAEESLGEPEDIAAPSPDLNSPPNSPLDSPPAESPRTPSTRRLGILPNGCRLSHVSKSDSSPSTTTTKQTNTPINIPAPASAASPASLMLAMVFPDGTASVPRRSLELSVAQPRTTPRIFSVLLSPWFAEATFTEVFPNTEATAPSDTTLSDAESPDDETSFDEVPR